MDCRAVIKVQRAKGPIRFFLPKNTLFCYDQ